MRSSRRAFLGRTAAVAALIAVSSCQTASPAVRKIPRLGYFQATNPPDPAIAPLNEAFLGGLRDLGYVEGRTIQIEWRYTENRLERFDEIAVEFVRMPVDVIAAAAAAAVQAAMRATTTIPIVMQLGSDPVENGFVQSLARPGVNVTGMAVLTSATTAKRLEVLKEAFPSASRVAILGDGEPTRQRQVKAAEEAARTLKLDSVRLEAREASELQRALELATRSGADALLVVNVPAELISLKSTIVGYAASRRIPAAYPIVGGWAEEGGLISFSDNGIDGFRRSASYVDRILKGASPAELPIELAAKFDLVVNLKTAKELGLTVPQSILDRATRVIQ